MKKILLLSITMFASLAAMAQAEIDTISTVFTNIDGKMTFNQPVTIADGDESIVCDVFENDSIVAEATLTCDPDNNCIMDITFGEMLSRGDYVLEVPAGMIVDVATGENAYEGSDIAFSSNPIPVKNYIGTYQDFSSEYKNYYDDTKNINPGFQTKITEYNDGSYEIFKWMNNDGYNLILTFDDDDNVATINNYLGTSIWAYYADNSYAWIYMKGYSYRYKMSDKIRIYLSLYIGGYTNYHMVLDEEPTRIEGDVNGDNMVDIADVNAVLTIIFSTTGYAEEGDVNKDGFVDIADVNAVLSIIYK